MVIVIPGDCTIASEKLLTMRNPFLVTYPMNLSLKIHLLPNFCDLTSVFVKIGDLCIHIYIFTYVCVCVSQPDGMECYGMVWYKYLISQYVLCNYMYH